MPLASFFHNRARPLRHFFLPWKIVQGSAQCAAKTPLLGVEHQHHLSISTLLRSSPLDLAVVQSSKSRRNR